MRIAVLADIHGNLPALRAVLAAIDDDPVGTIVVAGDVVAGPLARDCLELLHGRPEPVHWISGNGEREAVAAYDGVSVSDDPAGRAAAWSAKQLDLDWRDRLGSWPHSLPLDGVCFCHGSPRRDDEILTSASTDSDMLEALGEITESLVIGGHTHRQFIRRVTDRLTYGNAGSVGLPYEGRAGAFWLTVEDGLPRLRETQYDVAAAVDELVASGFEDVDSHLRGSLLEPADPDEVAASFEQMSGRPR
jgi:predicted phosphodiesterase